MKKRLLSLALAAAMAVGLAAPVMAYTTPDFTDVPSRHWAHEAIMKMADAGAIKGMGKGLFAPDDKLTAEMFVVLVGRVVFSDVTAEGSDWSGPYVAKAKEKGLLDGTKITDSNLKGEISRYDMAVILAKCAELLKVKVAKADSSKVADYGDIPNRYTEAVLAVYGMELIKGDQAGNFNGSNSITRAEAATVIMRLMELIKELPQNKEQTPIPTATNGPSGEKTGHGEADLEGARKAIIQCLTNMEEEVDTTPYHIQEDDLRALSTEILDSRLDKYYVFSTFWDTKDGLSTKVVFQYQGTKEQYAQYKQDMEEAEAKAEEIVASTVRPGMSNYEIAKALHDYLVLNVEYNIINYNYETDSKVGPGEYALYFPLIEHSAICSGYAYAYKYLMNLAGIPCEQISGHSRSQNHAWNIVQIDGEWYHVDTTWDDLGGDRICYDYFLKSDRALSGHYDWESPHPCTSTKYDNATNVLNQAEQEKEWEAERAAIMDDFMERFNSLPYRSAEGLTGTDELSDDELLSYNRAKVYFPMDEYSYEEMGDIFRAVASSADDQVFKINGQFTDMSYEGDQWYLVIYRWDTYREYERRQEAKR